MWEIKSFGVENKSTKKEKWVSEAMDRCGRGGYEKEGSCATRCRGQVGLKEERR